MLQKLCLWSYFVILDYMEVSYVQVGMEGDSRWG